MAYQNSNTIFDELPEGLQTGISVLSVSPILTTTIAEKILQRLNIANGNSNALVNQIQSYPVWVQRTRKNWAIDEEVRKIALNRLNGNGLEVKKKVLKVLKEYSPVVKDSLYADTKDFDLQIARLSLSIPDEQEQAITSLRKFFDTAEIFNNHESSRVCAAYIDENISLNKDLNKVPKYLLSAFFMRGLHAYRNEDNKKALKYLIPVWENRGNSNQAIKDAAIAAHLVGLIWSKNRNQFKEAEKAYLKSLELRPLVNDEFGLAQVYHSLGNLYSKKNDRYQEAEDAYIESLKIGENINHNHHLAQVYHSLGNLYSKKRNKFKEAEDAYLKSLELLNGIDDKYGLAQVYHSLGNLYSKKNDRYQDAEDAYLKSLELEEKNKNKYGLAQVYANYGKLKRKQSKFTKAKELFEKSLEHQTDSKYIKLIQKWIKKLPN